MPKLSRKKHIPLIALMLVVLLSAIAYYKKEIVTIDARTYKELLQKEAFISAKIVDRNVILETKEKHYSIIIDGVDLEALLDKVPVSMEHEVDYSLEIFVFLLSSILAFLLFAFGKKAKQPDEDRADESTHMRGAMATQHESAFYKKMSPSTSNITFKDVAGIEEVKSELMEVVDFLSHPQKYKSFGIKLPRGVLLIGPPGVGKTLIAKAVAGEAGVPFFYQSGASFVQIYVGMGAKSIRELFASAKSNAPAIIFIDEIDAVGRSRGGMHRNDERDATLNQLLTEMDGFEESNDVIVIAATNQIDVLDEALLRAGRFDRRVYIGLPNLSEREEILKVHLEGKKQHIDAYEVAKMSVGFSGAALATLVNEAAMNALKREASEIEVEDFIAVKEKVLLGKKRIYSYSEEEKQIQATYQAAKALCAYWYEIDFDKVSILGGHFKDVDREIESRTQMLSKIKLYLSGMVATNIFYDETFSNASEDVKRAKVLSQDMVERYAMGEGIYPTQIDSANILDEAIEDVEAFLLKMKKVIGRISGELLEKESLSKARLKSLVDDIL